MEKKYQEGVNVIYLMKKNNIEPESSSTYLSIINLYTRTKRFKDVIKTFEEMKVKNIEINEEIRNRFVSQKLFFLLFFFVGIWKN